ncbi:MAG: winged helix-turn-helix domain-containing protein [Henriciella sp.]
MPHPVSPQPRLSLRIDLPGGARFGPGMAALLGAIRAEGSIRAGASALGMSYPKALKLIDSMNAAFATPLVSARHGGVSRGGARLTETGDAVLQLYHEVCDTAATANRTRLATLASRLAPAGD